MMNKGLEVVEAHWEFDVEPSRIDVVIHPQSVVHSMVRYQDGTIIAQTGNGGYAYSHCLRARLSS